MRIFATKDFDRFAKGERIADEKLCDAIDRAAKGLVNANLGGELIKQRVARAGQGLSRGYRTVIAYRDKRRAVFLYGFAKKERDNISQDDLVRLKCLAAEVLKLTQEQIRLLVTRGEWREIICDAQEE